MPEDTGMAFVLVPHLDPTHESLMVDLLGRHTELRVCLAEEGMRIQANRVHVIPPNRSLAIRDSVLHLSDREDSRGLYKTVDFFLNSLAEDRREKAIGIILSGTGSDGTRGLQAIKAAGGMTMVQDPDLAAHDQMPRSAIAAGVVDFILPVEEMPAALIRYGSHPYVKEASKPFELPEGTAGQLSRIFALLRDRTRCDFRCYRKNMLMRRIQRRMSLSRIDQFSEYLDFLGANDDEVHRLFKDFLIGVTRFFREPEAYETLEREVIRKLVEIKGVDDEIRVWVPECATGEEAYSIAIIMIEQFEAMHRPCRLQVFATDIDDHSLQIGRQGLYPDGIAADVSSERLSRFFVKTDDHQYQIVKQLRDLAAFAPHNLLTDAPFSKIDLISCRNVMIYLEPEVQEQALMLFHFALNEEGYLMLGSSETVGRRVDLFLEASKKWRIYRRITPICRDSVALQIVSGTKLAERVPLPVFSEHEADLETLTQRFLRTVHAPAGVLIDSRFEILYFHGTTTRYLDLPDGMSTFDLIAMARRGLRKAIRQVVERALGGNGTMAATEAHVLRDGVYVPVRVTVKTILEPGTTAGLLWVGFEDSHEVRVGSESTEETRLVNEELQCANEELESSKEELQALNEELKAVNMQLEDRVMELQASHNDITNLLASTDIATIFLDTELRVRRFTPATSRLVNLIAADAGRPFRDFSRNFSDEDILQDARRVLERLSPVEKEVCTDEGRTFLRRILPYRTEGNSVEGVVITFVDITEQKLGEEQTRRLGTVLADSNDAITVQDLDGRIVAWNRGARRLYGYTESEALKKNIQDLVPEDRKVETRALAERISLGESIESFETQRIAKNGQVHDVLLTVSTLRDETGAPAGVVTTERDITAWKRAEKAQTKQGKILRTILDSIVEGLVVVDEEGKSHVFNPALEEIVGLGPADIPPSQWPEHYGFHLPDQVTLFPADDLPLVRAMHGEVVSGTEAFIRNDRRPKGVWVTVSAGPLRNETGAAAGAVCVLRDITNRKRAQEKLLQSERLAAIGKAIAGLAHESRNALQRGHAGLERLVMRLRENPEAVGLLAQVQKAQDDLHQLYEDVGFYAAPVRLTPEVCHLANIVEDAWEQLRPITEGRNTKLRQDPGEIDLHCEVDRSAMRQVIRNIFENSLAATRDALEIEVRYSKSEIGHDDAVRVTIEDNGPGLTPEACERIFEAFYTTKTHGTGLGMAIAERIIEAHGGRIEVGNAARRGAKIVMTLPRRRK